MQLFSHASRPFHLGPYPSERLGRTAATTLDLARVAGDGTLIVEDTAMQSGLSGAISDFMCALDAVRQGDRAKSPAEIPADPQERFNHLKAAGYFLDSALVGVCHVGPEHLLPR